MRIWDLDPGFLDRQRLLGEHRELHGLYNILTQGKKGYSRHPETLRWVGHVPALIMRHEILVQEMILRGYNHKSPLSPPEDYGNVSWPDNFIDTPADQFQLLRDKQTEAPGRIHLPCNRFKLWAACKYSVLARDPELYKRIGPETASGELKFPALAELLVRTLRLPPPEGRLKNALLHMYGYMKKIDLNAPDPSRESPAELLERIRAGVQRERIGYLNQSTALGELGAWTATADR